MSSHAAGHSSGNNANQDGLSNIRMIVRRIFEWGPIAIAIVILVVWLKFFAPWGGFTYTSADHVPVSNTQSQQTVYTPDAYAALSARCPGMIQHVILGAAGAVINPGNLCRVDFRVLSGQVALSGNGSSVVVDERGGELGSTPIEVATAASGSAEIIYALCPFGTKYGDTGCAP